MPIHTKKRCRFVPSRLIKLRVSAGYTMEELSKKIKRSKVSVHFWEKGTCEPGLDALKQLSKVFRKKITHFVKFEDGTKVS